MANKLTLAEVKEISNWGSYDARKVATALLASQEALELFASEVPDYEKYKVKCRFCTTEQPLDRQRNHDPLVHHEYCPTMLARAALLEAA